MTRDEIINIINKHSKELSFEIADDDLDFFVKSVELYLGNIDVKIKDFDLIKWKKYNYEPSSKYIGNFREDIIEESNTKVFKNSIKFKDNYVVVKNEK